MIVTVNKNLTVAKDEREAVIGQYLLNHSRADKKYKNADPDQKKALRKKIKAKIDVNLTKSVKNKKFELSVLTKMRDDIRSKLDEALTQMAKIRKPEVDREKFLDAWAALSRKAN